MPNVINHINRAVLIVLLLVLEAGALGFTIAVTYDLVHGYSFGSGSGMGLIAHAINASAARTHAWLAPHALAALGTGVAISLFGLLWLWLEVRDTVAQPQLVLSRGHLGKVAISLAQISVLAQHEAELVAGVREARTVAQARKAGIRVEQIIAVEPEQQLPALAEQIQQRVKTSLEYHLGFPVAAVRVQLQQAALSKSLR